MSSKRKQAKLTGDENSTDELSGPCSSSFSNQGSQEGVLCANREGGGGGEKVLRSPKTTPMLPPEVLLVHFMKSD